MIKDLSQKRGLRSITSTDIFRDDAGASTDGLKKQTINLLHELDADFHSEPISQTVVVTEPTRFSISSEVKSRTATALRSPAYVASTRRRKTAKIAEAFDRFCKQPDRSDLVMIMFPVVNEIRIAIDYLADKDTEGNSREILRQLRDSMTNGHWDQYIRQDVQSVAGSALSILASKEVVEPEDVERVRDQLSSAQLTAVSLIPMIDDDEYEEEEREVGQEKNAD